MLTHYTSTCEVSSGGWWIMAWEGRSECEPAPMLVGALAFLLEASKWLYQAPKKC
jgi:hypothetical protein